MKCRQLKKIDNTGKVCFITAKAGSRISNNNDNNDNDKRIIEKQTLIDDLVNKGRTILVFYYGNI
jgi:hypothetical protein